MSPQASLPACPKCRRPIAAWKKDHCVYCGEVFPPDLRDGYEAPEALKWVDRPAISPEAARQLEMMKVVPMPGDKKTRSVVRAMGLAVIPVVAVLFYMLWSISGKYLPGWGVLLVGALVMGYLVWSISKVAR
jgi:hypothetical protein